MKIYNMFKHIFDVLVAGFFLLLFSPFLFIIAVIVILSSGRPIFFMHNRVGIYGKVFKIIKFRTMVPNAPLVGPALTMKRDPRVTKIGRFLRKWKIDELPQFFNVLKGDMSLVGPRPEIPSIIKEYKDEEKAILNIKPGIFGPSQIAGRLEEEEYPDNVNIEEYYIKNILPDKIARDLQYVNERCFVKDFTYFLKGIRAVGKSKGTILSFRFSPRFYGAKYRNLGNGYRDSGIPRQIKKH